MSNQGGIISLLPESRRKLEINIPGENRPLYYGAGVVLLVVLLFAGMKIYAGYLVGQLAEIDNEISAVENQRDKKFEQELLLLQKQFSLVGDVLKNHPIWSNVLSQVQGLTPSQVQIENLAGVINESKLEIKGRALNYTVIARQMAALLSNPAIVDLYLDKVSTFSTGALEYNMRVFFDKESFLLNTK
ncbi:MAG: hypothetical protein G01um101444_398 [Parcubacteria group bacterium Gr01-1014_44]|nr:MAG: hypothetical protein G01um101444_398 [Parcubacteria group bacterium Gr01-1014_44]